MSFRKSLSVACALCLFTSSVVCLQEVQNDSTLPFVNTDVFGQTYNVAGVQPRINKVFQDIKYSPYIAPYVQNDFEHLPIYEDFTSRYVPHLLDEEAVSYPRVEATVFNKNVVNGKYYDVTDFPQIMYKVHNALRVSVGLPRVQWSHELEAFATQAAAVGGVDECSVQKTPEILRQQVGKFQNVGENVYTTLGPLTVHKVVDAMRTWISAMGCYKFGPVDDQCTLKQKPGCEQMIKVVKEFVQVMAAPVTHIGCAVHRCNSCLYSDTCVQGHVIKCIYGSTVASHAGAVKGVLPFDENVANVLKVPECYAPVTFFRRKSSTPSLYQYEVARNIAAAAPTTTVCSSHLLGQCVRVAHNIPATTCSNCQGTCLTPFYQCVGRNCSTTCQSCQCVARDVNKLSSPLTTTVYNQFQQFPMYQQYPIATTEPMQDLFNQYSVPTNYPVANQYTTPNQLYNNYDTAVPKFVDTLNPQVSFPNVKSPLAKLFNKYPVIKNNNYQAQTVA